MNAAHIASRELKGYLTSPMAFVMMGAFLVITGFMHWTGVRAYAEYSAQSGMMGGLEFTMNDLIQNLYDQAVIILTFMMPLLTMRLFAEERRAHTLEFLLASPSTTWDIVLGKFLASLAFFMVMVGAMAVFPLTMASMTTLDYGPILTTYLGFALMGAGFVSLGMLASSLTESQLLAAVISFAALLVLYLMGWLSATGDGAGVGFGAGYFSVAERVGAFTKGLIRAQDVVYWLSFTGLFLLATHQRLESLRYR